MPGCQNRGGESKVSEWEFSGPYFPGSPKSEVRAAAFMAESEDGCTWKTLQEVVRDMCEKQQYRIPPRGRYVPRDTGVFESTRHDGGRLREAVILL